MRLGLKVHVRLDAIQKGPSNKFSMNSPTTRWVAIKASEGRQAQERENYVIVCGVWV